MSHLKRVNLIENLSMNVLPVSSRNNILLPAVLWFLTSWVYVIALSLYLGPLRGGALESLITSPQFAIESFVGFISGALFCIIAFQESIPGLRHKWLIHLSYFCAILWISCYVVDLSFPALEPSRLGKRAHCVLEAYLYSLPPLIGGYILIYRRFPLDCIRAGLFLGISAGMLPALFMQFACMYEPSHILTHHLAPALIVIAAGALLGFMFNKLKCPLEPRSRS